MYLLSSCTRHVIKVMLGLPGSCNMKDKMRLVENGVCSQKVLVLPRLQPRIVLRMQEAPFQVFRVQKCQVFTKLARLD